MTTRKDIVMEQLGDKLLNMKVEGLLTKEEYDQLQETMYSEIDYRVQEDDATLEQIAWHFSHN